MPDPGHKRNRGRQTGIRKKGTLIARHLVENTEIPLLRGTEDDCLVKVSIMRRHKDGGGKI